VIRISILRILIHRELLRLIKSPSALIVLVLLTGVALMVATSKPPKPPTPTCWIVYWEDGPWIDFLEQSLADEPGIPMKIRHHGEMRKIDGRIAYPTGDMAIEIEPPIQGLSEESRKKMWFVYRYSGKDANVMRPHLQWFWHKSIEHLGNTPEINRFVTPLRARTRADITAMIEQTSVKDLITTEIAAALMVLLIQFFACCYLLVSFTAQDRERGTLMALVLTPATTREILFSKFLFHLSISVVMTAVLLGILVPQAIPRPILWMIVVANSVTLMCIGTIITTLTKSQTAAGLLTLCYLLGQGVIFYLATKFAAFEIVKFFMFERYGFPMLFLAVQQDIPLWAATGLIWLGVLVAIWLISATTLFHRCGWR
jgi:ABC-type transport system involved in multi-copper enzyme maturation permease subunit